MEQTAYEADGSVTIATIPSTEEVEVDKPDRSVAEEFRKQPIGHHSPELERVLFLFRGQDMKDKYVLVEDEPFKKWRIGKLTGKRGDPVQLEGDEVYTSIETAEWEIFKRRWKKHFGEELDD